MLKRSLVIMIIMVMSSFLASSLIIVKDKDEVDKAYIKETYGTGIKAPMFSAEQMVLTEFNEFKKNAMEDAAYSRDMTDEQRSELMKKLKSMEFKYTKMVFFKIVASEPILPEYLKFNVKLLNAKGESLSIFDYYQAYKQVVTTRVMGVPVTTTHYVYYWIIEADKQLIKKNYPKEEQPIKLEIEFPNGQKRTYTARI